MSTPLRDVLSALEAGSGTLDAVARRTGLARDVVAAAADHLVRLGRVNASVLAAGCGSGACGSCPSGSGGTPGCGRPPQGPVLVALSVRRPAGATAHS